MFFPVVLDDCPNNRDYKLKNSQQWPYKREKVTRMAMVAYVDNSTVRWRSTATGGCNGKNGSHSYYQILHWCHMAQAARGTLFTSDVDVRCKYISRLWHTHTQSHRLSVSQSCGLRKEDEWPTTQLKPFQKGKQFINMCYQSTNITVHKIQYSLSQCS